MSILHIIDQSSFSVSAILSLIDFTQLLHWVFIFPALLLILLILKLVTKSPEGSVAIKFNANSVFIGFFFLILLLPSFAKILGEESKPTFEKRKLAEEPKGNFGRDFPQNFESWYSDHFGLRSEMISLFNRFKISAFKVSPMPEKLRFGKDGFIFYNDRADHIYESYTKRNLLDSASLAKKIKRLKSRTRKARKNGQRFVCGFWPNKHSIYPDKLPLSIKMQIKNGQSLADQIASQLKGEGLQFIDVRPAIKTASKKQQTYCKLDTHWNLFGAFAGYSSMIQQIFGPDSLDILTEKDYKISRKLVRTGDLVRMTGVDSISGYTDNIAVFTLKSGETYRWADAVNLPKNVSMTVNPEARNKLTILIFGDSYLDAVKPFFANDFEKVIFSHTPYKYEFIKKYGPDIIIHCPVERYIILL